MKILLANCCHEVVQVQQHYLLKDFMRKVAEFTLHVSLQFNRDTILHFEL